jgi:hypothetical protein
MTATTGLQAGASGVNAYCRVCGWRHWSDSRALAQVALAEHKCAAKESD